MTRDVLPVKFRQTARNIGCLINPVVRRYTFSVPVGLISYHFPASYKAGQAAEPQDQQHAAIALQE
jgi:hypothetical protein